MPTILMALGLLMAGVGERPFLGVATHVHDQDIDIDGQTYPHGLVVDRVVPGSAAEAAGVLAGDIIVALTGVDFSGSTAELAQRFHDSLGQRSVGDEAEITVFRDRVVRQAQLDGEVIDDPDIWQAPDLVVADRVPGTRLTLTVEHVRRLVTLEATLTARPRVNPVVHPLPPNAEIFEQSPVEHQAAELAARLVEHFGVQEDYAALRERLADLVRTGDPFRLPCVAYVMRAPFSLSDIAPRLAETGDAPRAALVAAARHLALKPAAPAAPVDRVPAALNEHLAHIEQIVERAAGRFEAAFGDLSPEERTYLEEALPDVANSFREVVMVMSDPDYERRERVRKFIALAQRVDRAELLAAGQELAQLAEPGFLRALRAALDEQPPTNAIRCGTALGEIVVAGPRNDWHRGAPAVLIDYGGHDRYTNVPRRPVAVVIDFAGDDMYQATFDGAQAGAVFGLSLLVDVAGDDVYIAQEWAQGAAAFGVGVLWDQAGDDSYRAQDYSQAAALCGVGLLMDNAGNDRYDAPRYAQGLGLPGGFAAVTDRDGDDYYYCSGRDRTNYGTEGVFDAFAQGCGIGFRGLASGGIGVLRDDAGDDVYLGGNFAQGGGYYYGLGALLDRAGADRYWGSRYAQAWAAHQAIGFLADDAGDDVYDCWRGVGQSCSWDETVTMLIDHAGDDRYSGGGFALCASHNNGWALMVDAAGDDLYQRLPRVPRADGNDEVTSFSLMLDLEAATAGETFPVEAAVMRHGNRNGWFLQAPGDLDAALEQWEAMIKP